MKKLNKFQKKIKELESKVHNLDMMVHYRDTTIINLGEENKKLNEYKIIKQGSIDTTVQSLLEENRRLFEVVRWHVNPDTAKHPFAKSIEQKTDRDNNFTGQAY